LLVAINLADIGEAGILGLCGWRCGLCAAGEEVFVARANFGRG
jgi:hypothetical protein